MTALLAVATMALLALLLAGYCVLWMDRLELRTRRLQQDLDTQEQVFDEWRHAHLASHRLNEEKGPSHV